MSSQYLWTELVCLVATINVHDVLNVVYCSWSCCGDTKEIISQLWKSKNLDKYGQKPHYDRGKFLFGTRHLKSQVETDTTERGIVR